MNMLNDSAGYGIGFPWHIIIGVIILILIVWTVVRVITRYKRLKQNPAKEAVKERYAKGETSKEQYEEEKKNTI